MQNPRATESPSHRRFRLTSIVVAALLLALSLVSAPGIAAQDATPDAGTPVATPAAATPGATPAATGEDVIGNLLMQYDFEEMPQAPFTVRLLRITLEPGAESPMHTHPGPEFNLVESGTLTANIDGTAITGIGSDSSEVTEDQTLGIGQWIMYPAGTGMNLVNEGEDNVILLAAVIQPAGSDIETITYADGLPTEDDLQGVSYVVLGDGLIQQFPAGGATVTVDRLNVGAGEPVPAFSGPALLSKSSGEFAIRAEEGDVQVTRTSDPRLRPNAIAGQEFTLADDDAAFFPSGYQAIERGENSGDVVFTRLLIQPGEALADDPAEVAVMETASSETAETTGDDDQASGDGFGIGATVAINEDSVRLRAEATTDSDIVDSYPAGTRFEIVDGPVDGENYTWFEVVGLGDLSDVQGWLTTDFLDVIEPAPEDGGDQADDGSAGSDEVQGTPDLDIFDIDLPDAESGDSGEPPADIEVGAVVETTDDNLRIRAEANAGADIIVAVPTGTELEVIGGPEQADNFTWYEVQSTVDEDVTGWVASDFLEVVEEAGS